MEFFSNEIRAPEADLLAMLTTVGNQIGMFMDRQREQEELSRFFMLSLDLLVVVGFDGYFKRVNPAWTKVLGYTEAQGFLISEPMSRDAMRQLLHLTVDPAAEPPLQQEPPLGPKTASNTRRP